MNRPKNFFSRKMAEFLIEDKVRLNINERRIGLIFIVVAIFLLILYYPVWAEFSPALYNLNSMDVKELGNYNISNFASIYGIPTNEDYVKIVSKDQAGSLAIRNKK